MTAREAKAVLDFIEDGGLVKMSGPYVDGFADVYENDADEIVIRSEVCSEKPLCKVPFHSLSFFRNAGDEVAELIEKTSETQA
jgi:hypothetical protein